MSARLVEVGTEPLDGPTRNSVGGRPYLDEDQPWPECFCGERLVLFFQLDIPWRVLLQRHATQPTAETEPSLRALPLTLRPFTDTSDADGIGAQEFKVGGAPSWAQFPEYYRCACGADMVYLCQVPENTGFAVRPGRPEQPYGGGTDTYELFLGTEVYLLACPARCDPAALWPVTRR
ncbi:hypothetical protein [Streptomyces sp. NPDC001100]